MTDPAAPFWSFPKAKPQFFAESLRTLALAVPYYGFGRRFPRALHASCALALFVPPLRNRIATRVPFELPCGWAVWSEIRSALSAHGATAARWAYFRSQWRLRRFSALPLTRSGAAPVFVRVQPRTESVVNPRARATRFRIPTILDSVHVGEWSVLVCQALPRFHRAVAWDRPRLTEIARECSRVLEGVVERPRDIPPHWRPIHGDFTPSNLREDGRGSVWLIDYEDATWGPPLADLFRFALVVGATRDLDATELASWVTDALALPDADVSEAARFWLGHHNLQPGPGENPEITEGKAAAMARRAIVREALAMLVRDRESRVEVP